MAMENKEANWGSFKVADLFLTEPCGNRIQVPTGAWMPIKDLIEGDIPRVTVSSMNNGITGH